jgi:hypothetical protein
MQAAPLDSSSPVVPRKLAAPASWARLRAELVSGRWSLYAAYFGASWIITGLYWRTTIQLDVATIQQMVAGTAEAPFAYRPLMPWILRGVSWLNGMDDPVLADMGVRLLILFGLMLLLRRWMRHFVEPLLADISPLLLGVVLPGTFFWYWPYDFAGFLVWTACLLALVERRYPLYLILLAIGTLNRETTAFLIGIFAVTQWEALGPRRTLRWTAAQIAIYTAIYSGIRIVIHPHGGEFVENHIMENLSLLIGANVLSPFENWMFMLSGMGFLWLLAPWHWSKKSIFLRRACWILPAYALAIFLGGRLAEPRLWNTWLPIVLALVGQTLMEFAGRERDSAPSASPS